MKVFGGGLQWVDAGDTANWDYSVGDLTTDATYNTLDLSAKGVPLGAKRVRLHGIVKDDAVNSTFTVRQVGNSNTRNESGVKVTVANQDHILDAVVTLPDNSASIEYYGSNVAFVGISICIMGWWI